MVITILAFERLRKEYLGDRYTGGGEGKRWDDYGLPIDMGVLLLFTMTSAASTIGTAFLLPLGGVSVTEVVDCAGAENILLVSYPFPAPSMIDSGCRSYKNTGTHIHTASATPSNRLSVLRRLSSSCVSALLRPIPIRGELGSAMDAPSVGSPFFCDLRALIFTCQYLPPIPSFRAVA